MAYNPIQFPKMLYHPVTKEPLIVQDAREMEQVVSKLGYGFSPAIDPTPGQTHPGALHAFDEVVALAQGVELAPARYGAVRGRINVLTKNLQQQGLYMFLPKTIRQKLSEAEREHFVQQGLQGVQQMIEFVKEAKVAALDVDELMLALGLCRVIGEQYVAAELDTPKWLEPRQRTILYEVKKRLADDLLRAEEELEALKEKEERRNELKARIEKLRGKISEQV